MRTGQMYTYFIRVDMLNDTKVNKRQTQLFTTNSPVTAMCCGLYQDIYVEFDAGLISAKTIAVIGFLIIKSCH